MSITIEDYMLKDLNLSGNTLLVFAYLTANTPFSDNLGVIQRDLHISRSTLNTTLATLEEKGLVTREVRGSNKPSVFRVGGVEVNKTPSRDVSKDIEEFKNYRHGI